MKILPLLLAVLPSISLAQAPSIRYTLGMPNPSTHLFNVELVIDGIPESDRELDLVLPVWRPGRYVISDFAGGITTFAVTGADEQPLRWAKVEKSKWRIETGGNRRIAARYSVYANETNQRTRGLNDQHAFVDGTSVFMFCETYRNIPLLLTVECPTGWHVSTGLEGAGKEFTAHGYDELVDCPLEIGTQKDVRFDVDGVPHLLSIFGDGNWNSDTLVRDIGKIVKVEKDLWGKFPYRRYVFLLECSPSGGGGTEHLNSTIMQIQPYVFRNPDSYRGFLGLVSHEFFHTWNVKQVRPKSMLPYDYMKENYSRELWIAEGTTSYYGNLLLRRAGFTTPDQALDAIAGEVQNDRGRPGNDVQPVSDASFDAWVKYWRFDEDAYNTESDYYEKGSAVSMLLDLAIRQSSGDKQSLDDVMRTLFQRFPLGGGTGYTLEDVQKIAEECAGTSLKDFFDLYVFGTAALPWDKELMYAGLQLMPRDTVKKVWLGVGTSESGGRTTINRVIAGSPADRAGLEIGDEFLALNGVRVRSSDLSDRLSEHKKGETVAMTVFRDDHLRNVSVVLDYSPLRSYKLVRVESPTDLQKQIYESWLGAPWPAAQPLKSTRQ